MTISSELENERKQILKNIDFYLKERQFNDTKEKELIANLTYLNSSYDKAIRFNETDNTQMLDIISNLNKEVSTLQKRVKIKVKLYKERKNMDKGIKQSLSDTSYSYKTLLYNIALKDVVVLLFLYSMTRF